MACDPKQLATDANCFLCEGVKVNLAVQTLLLARLAGGSVDPKVLASQAATAGFMELSEKEMLAIQAQKLCQIAGG